MVGRVTVLLDGSERAERALAAAAELAWRLGAGLRLLRDAESAAWAEPDAQTVTAGEYLAAVRRGLAARGQEATTEVCPDGPGGIAPCVGPGDLLVVAAAGATAALVDAATRAGAMVLAVPGATAGTGGHR